jgi:hypothetical protein
VDVRRLSRDLEYANYHSSKVGMGIPVTALVIEIGVTRRNLEILEWMNYNCVFSTAYHCPQILHSCLLQTRLDIELETCD